MLAKSDPPIEYEEIATFIERHIRNLDIDRDGRLSKDETALAAFNHDFTGRDGLIVAFLHACYAHILKADLILHRNDRKKLDEILHKGINANTIRKIGTLVEEGNAHAMATAANIPMWAHKLMGAAMLVDYDVDKDSRLSRDEVRNAMSKPDVSLLVRLNLQYLLDNFDTISGGDDHISFAEAWAHYNRDSIEAEFLAAACDAVLTVMENRSCAAAKALYATPNQPTQSIKPEAIRQGFNQDCLFLAMMASVAALNPKLIQRSIKPLGGNPESFEVVFPNAPKEKFIVNAPSDAELSLYCGGSDFGIWPAILEKACGAYCMKSPLRRLHWVRPWNWRPLVGAKNQAENATFGGWDLFGPVVRNFVQSATIEDFDKSLREQIKLKKAAALASIAAPKRHDKIRPNHAYALVHYQWETNVVRVYNPWGRLGRDTSGVDPSQGFVDLTLQQAYDTFTTIYRTK
jgi:hypothetical protein